MNKQQGYNSRVWSREEVTKMMGSRLWCPLMILDSIPTVGTPLPQALVSSGPRLSHPQCVGHSQLALSHNALPLWSPCFEHRSQTQELRHPHSGHKQRSLLFQLGMSGCYCEYLSLRCNCSFGRTRNLAPVCLVTVLWVELQYGLQVPRCNTSTANVLNN